MSWLIDNASTFHILLGIVAAGLVVVWRYNSRVKYLTYALCALATMILLWLLTINVKTDRQQLEANVVAMARAVENKQLEGMFEHISNDFRYRGVTREMLYDIAQKHIKAHEVKNISINRFNAEISRENKFARTGFIVSATADREIVFRTEADFVLEGEQWKLKTLRFYRIGQDTEFDMIVAP